MLPFLHLVILSEMGSITKREKLLKFYDDTGWLSTNISIPVRVFLAFYLSNLV